MKIHKLHPPKKFRKNRRVGRGPSSGWGKTSGKGNKGSKQRTGTPYFAGFEGGQMPLYRRLPKRGFKSHSSMEFEVINIGRFAKFPVKGEITPEELKKKGWIKKRSLLKILGRGNVKVPLTIKAHAFSRSAKEKIEKAGGKVLVISGKQVLEKGNK